MSKVRNGVLFAWAMLLMALACIVCANAIAEDSALVNSAVQAVLPDNQIDDKATNIELMMVPGQEQVLQVIIKNKGNQEIEVAIEANAAHSDHNEAPDPSLAVDSSELVNVLEPTIVVSAGEQAVTEFLVKMPDESHEGIVRGGFTFAKLDQDEGTGGEDSVHRYVISAQLHQSHGAIQPEFKLLGASIADPQTPALRIDLRNPQPAIARKIALQVDVFPELGTHTILRVTKSGIDMAPYSQMPYSLYLDADQGYLEPGAYRAEVELQFEGRTWQFETPFVIE